jgi:hypothetical protein
MAMSPLSFFFADSFVVCYSLLSVLHVSFRPYFLSAVFWSLEVFIGYGVVLFSRVITYAMHASVLSRVTYKTCAFLPLLILAFSHSEGGLLSIAFYHRFIIIRLHNHISMPLLALGHVVHHSHIV